MQDIKGIVPKYDDSDAHIVRRLGAAVVGQWAKLPPEAQSRLLRQAIYAYDDHEAVQLEQQIVHFIATHQGWAK